MLVILWYMMFLLLITKVFSSYGPGEISLSYVMAPYSQAVTSSRPLLFYPDRCLAFCSSAGSRADAVHVLTAALQLMSADLINPAKFMLSSISFGPAVPRSILEYNGGGSVILRHLYSSIWDHNVMQNILCPLNDHIRFKTTVLLS